MPVSPYPSDGVILDLDGSTRVENATVIVMNVTKHESMQQLTNSNGEFLIDLANFPTDYSNSDKIQITAFSGSGSGRKVLDRRHTVDTIVGAHSTGNMILHPMDLIYSNTSSRKWILGGNAANRTGSAVEIHLYDRYNDNLIFVVKVPANANEHISFGDLVGVPFDGGVCTIYSDETTTNITYTGDSAATARPSVVLALSWK